MPKESCEEGRDGLIDAFVARSLSGLGVWLLDCHSRIPAWPVMPAGRWVVGRHLGHKRGPTGAWAVGVWGAGATLQLGRESARGRGHWTAKRRSKVSKPPCPAFNSRRSISKPQQRRRFGILRSICFPSLMERCHPAIPQRFHHPGLHTHPPPRASLCSNRDRRRHPALNPIHLHAAVDRHQPACVVPDMTRVSAWSAWLDPDRPSKPTPLSGW